jgi:hypothetical protein
LEMLLHCDAACHATLVRLRHADDSLPRLYPVRTV